MSLRAMGRWLLSRVGCECPLCGARVAGARLCAGCEADICETDSREHGSHETGMHDAGILGAAVGAPSTARQQASSRCPRCALRLHPGAPHCASCLGTPRAFSRTVAAFDYSPPADTLILMLKTRLRLSMAPVLARLIAAAVGRDGPLADGALLVAIPASRASLRQRGMNPAAEIARS
ncbi:ComF family protein, partial [Achromobacter sp.]|uniref:ComF family protein n=1 Tax=Achromobacter sp. TaxID=134375 RepID=UPI003C70DA01